LFGSVGQARHVAVVVVAPHQRDVVGHLQPHVVDVEHLFVRNEHLRLFGRVAEIFADELLLVVDDELQSVELLLHCLHALHRAVVDAAHADGQQVAALRALHFFQPLYPVVLYRLSVGDVVKRAAFLLVPLSDVVAQQRLTVRRADGDAAAVGHGLGARRLEEAYGARVHGGPDSVGTEAEQQLEHLLVGVLADDAERGFVEMAVAPGTQRPVLVVEEDTTILHRRMLEGMVAGGQCQSALPLRVHVAPPCPWRHTGEARELQYAVGRAAGIAAHDPQLAVAGGTDGKGLLVFLEAVDGEAHSGKFSCH